MGEISNQIDQYYSLLFCTAMELAFMDLLKSTCCCSFNLHLMLKGEMGRVLQLLGRSSGFVVAPTHRPCTKGLWMWSAPLKRTAPDGSEYNLLLLDSEGIDAYDQTVCLNPQEYLCNNDLCPSAVIDTRISH